MYAVATQCQWNTGCVAHHQSSAARGRMLRRRRWCCQPQQTQPLQQAQTGRESETRGSGQAGLVAGVIASGFSAQHVLPHQCMAPAVPATSTRRLFSVAPAGAWPLAVGAGDGVATGGGTGAGVAPPLPVSEKSVGLLPQPTSVMGTEVCTCCAAALPLAACVRPSTEGVTDAELSACRQSHRRQHAYQHKCCLICMLRTCHGFRLSASAWCLYQTCRLQNI
jgi:hypothetical protein